jgi:hypothetical protein
LKVVEYIDITISFVDNETMNKIMVDATVNEDDDLLMFNVTNYLEVLGSREASEII